MSMRKWLAAVGAISLVPAQLLAMGCFTGPYAGVEGDFGFSNNSYHLKFSQNDTNGTSFADSFSMEHKSSFGIYGNLGYAFDNGFATQVSVGYRDKQERAKGDSDVTLDSSNVLVTVDAIFSMDTHYVIMPVLGAGVGISWFDGEGKYEITDSTPTTESGDYSNAKKTNLIYKLELGVAFNTNSPFVFDIKYKYIGSPKFSDPKDLLSEPANTTTTFDKNGLRIQDIEYNDHTIAIGVKYLFATV